jgi:hypothetical protein
MGELGLELVEAGFSKSCRDVTDHTGDCSSDRVVCLLGVNNSLLLVEILF